MKTKVCNKKNNICDNFEKLILFRLIVKSGLKVFDWQDSKKHRTIKVKKVSKADLVAKQ